jgi:hypothetical protein
MFSPFGAFQQAPDTPHNPNIRASRQFRQKQKICDNRQKALDNARKVA